MARQSVAKTAVEPVREDMKYHNDAMRGLSIFLGGKDIGNHLDSLTQEQRRLVISYFDSSRDAAIQHLQLLGTLLSGYDKHYANVDTFGIGWLVQSLANDADVGTCISSLCEGANMIEDYRAGKVTA